MKREVGDTSGSRKETARDLSSFALDGGALLVGLNEDKQDRTFSPAPQPLDGLAEKVEQVATSLIDPPLFVRTTVILSSSAPAVGYLFVSIPASPVAPHMVDGVYYGRGDKTRTRLSDAEVTRHHSRRESQEAIADRLLDEEVARDPVPLGERATGRLYAVAHPLTARRDLGLAVARGSHQSLLDLSLVAESALAQELRDLSPGPRAASHRFTRAQGTALSSGAVSGDGRTFNKQSEYTSEEEILDIEYREDGGIRLLLGRITPTWPIQGTPTIIFDA